MFNHPLEMPLLTYKGSFSNGKLQASILESVPFRGLVHHSVPFRRIVPTLARHPDGEKSQIFSKLTA